MKKFNLILGAISLTVGAILVAQSLAGGVKPLGLIMGGLLLANGFARLWLARRADAGRPKADATADRDNAPMRQD